MADVLLARAEGIQGFTRHVVLKRIRPEHARDRSFIEMFFDEARVAATLHHQNIVQVHDICEAGGEVFFAMEYLHGEDLRRLLSVVSRQRSQVPLAFALAIVSAVAAGLHYAHERRGSDRRPLKIVHRDITPSNVFIGYDGAVKVVDFGIAKARSRKTETRTGKIKGKVSYMSPEQCRGAQIDRRSDVYALGVLLYELATTTRLFKGDNAYLVMDAIVKGEVPPPHTRRADLPYELCAMIMKALALDPAERYQTAEEMRLALDAFALRSRLSTSTAALAGYMRAVFGERAEPWVESVPGVHTGGGGQTVHLAALGARGTAPRITTRETRSSMKLAWESVRQTRPARAVWIGAPCAALVVGSLLGQNHSSKAAPMPTVAVDQPTAEITETPAERVALAEPAPPPDVVKPVKKRFAKPRIEPTTVSLPPAPTPPLPTPPPPAEPKPEVEITIPTLSAAAITEVASEHGRQLARCEGTAQLRGDVTVTFQIDGAGRVIKSQLSSSIANAKVSSCILQAVNTWKFPAGPARGLYTILYQ